MMSRATLADRNTVLGVLDSSGLGSTLGQEGGTIPLISRTVLVALDRLSAGDLSTELTTTTGLARAVEPCSGHAQSHRLRQ
jgi:hypothetical protein